VVRREIGLDPRSKGLHEITSQVVAGLPEIEGYRVGLVHLMILHTSASLVVTENASPDVLADLEDWFSEVVPESRPWSHSIEGSDDMPSHVRSVLTQTSLTIPIDDGRLLLGTWQGIFLAEHRDRGGPRRIVATIWGTTTDERDGPVAL
jgi:secondary thiamine-phosphate synthase enzyme